MNHLGKGPGSLHVNLESTSTKRQQIRPQRHPKGEFLSECISSYAGCLSVAQWFFLLILQQLYWDIIYSQWSSFCDFSLLLCRSLWWSFHVFEAKFIHVSFWMHPNVCMFVFVSLCSNTSVSENQCLWVSFLWDLIAMCAWVYVCLWTCLWGSRNESVFMSMWLYLCGVGF